MGNRYIIELEEIPFVRTKFRIGADKLETEMLYRVKGFNSLVFDKKGIEKLTPYVDKANYWYEKRLKEGMGVEQMSYLVPINTESHWIPVEQDLPKIGEYVLCKTTARYFGKYHVCKFVDKDEWVDRPHFDWDRNGFPHVVAWMRFEPYKEMTE